MPFGNEKSVPAVPILACSAAAAPSRGRTCSALAEARDRAMLEFFFSTAFLVTVGMLVVWAVK
jgi:hypothetical protein